MLIYREYFWSVYLFYVRFKMLHRSPRCLFDGYIQYSAIVYTSYVFDRQNSPTKLDSLLVYVLYMTILAILKIVSHVQVSLKSEYYHKNIPQTKPWLGMAFWSTLIKLLANIPVQIRVHGLVWQRDETKYRHWLAYCCFNDRGTLHYDTLRKGYEYRTYEYFSPPFEI